MNGGSFMKNWKKNLVAAAVLVVVFAAADLGAAAFFSAGSG
jgi:hypothetical protein